MFESIHMCRYTKFVKVLRDLRTRGLFLFKEIISRYIELFIVVYMCAEFPDLYDYMSYGTSCKTKVFEWFNGLLELCLRI